MTVMLSPAPPRRADNFITSRSFEQRGGYLFCFNVFLVDFASLQFLSTTAALPNFVRYLHSPTIERGSNL
jgi:hypothetical protein